MTRTRSHARTTAALVYMRPWFTVHSGFEKADHRAAIVRGGVEEEKFGFVSLPPLAQRQPPE